MNQKNTQTNLVNKQPQCQFDKISQGNIQFIQDKNTDETEKRDMKLNNNKQIDELQEMMQIMLYQTYLNMLEVYIHQNSLFLDWQAVLMLLSKYLYNSLSRLRQQDQKEILQIIIRLYNLPYEYIQNTHVLYQIIEFQAEYYEHIFRETISQIKDCLTTIIRGYSITEILDFKLNKKPQKIVTIPQQITKSIFKKRQLQIQLRSAREIREREQLYLQISQEISQNQNKTNFLQQQQIIIGSQYCPQQIKEKKFIKGIQFENIQSRIEKLMNLIAQEKIYANSQEQKKLFGLIKGMQNSLQMTKRGFQKVILVNKRELIYRIYKQLSQPQIRSISSIAQPLKLIIQKLFDILFQQEIEIKLKSLEIKSMFNNWNIDKQVKKYKVDKSFQLKKVQFNSLNLKMVKHILKKGVSRYLNSKKDFNGKFSIYFTNSQVLSIKQTRKLIKTIETSQLKIQKLCFDNYQQFDCQYLIKYLQSNQASCIRFVDIEVHQPIQKLIKNIDYSYFFEGRNSIFLNINNYLSKSPNIQDRQFENLTQNQKVKLKKKYFQFVKSDCFNSKIDSSEFVKLSHYLRIKDNLDLSSLANHSLFYNTDMMSKVHTVYFQRCFGLEEKSNGMQKTLLQVIAQNSAHSLRVFAIKDSQQQLSLRTIQNFENLNVLILTNSQSLSIESLYLSLTHLSSLEHLNLSHNSWVSDQTTKCISKLIQLNFLSLYQTNITDQSLNMIEALTKLQTFVCGKTKVNGQAVVRLVKKSNCLKKLNIAELTGEYGYGRVNDSDLYEISCQQQHHRHLTHLNIDNCYHISDDGIGYFHKLKFLSIRSILDMRISSWQKSNLKQRGIIIRQ